MPKLPTNASAVPGLEIGRPEVLVVRAFEAYRVGDAKEAARLYKAALRIDPTNIDAMNGLGAYAGNTGDLLEAVQQFENSLRIEPNQPLIRLNHGLALLKVGLTEEALLSFDRAILISPDCAMAYSSRGSTLANLGRHEEAIAAYDNFERFSPDDPVLAKQRGISLQWCGRYDDALQEFDRSIELDPDHAEGWVSKAMLLMTLGNLPAGFALYEWRWRMGSWLLSPSRGKREYPGQLWLGETDIAGKTILIHGEQGFGDMIQFCRYATLAAQAGARVIVEAPKNLTALMATLEGPALAISDDEPQPAHDLRCPMMSLPLALGTTIETIPAAIPYLHADPVLASAWRARLSDLRGCRIGLVWGAGSRVGNEEMVAIEHRKSLPLKTLAPLTTIKGCDFVSLQLGPAAAQVATSGMTLRDDTGDLKDFADTAALIDNLDLVISVCTSTAHLAGALGKPVWLLNRFDTDWRWFLDRTDSPWYPTMRVFRQPKAWDWDTVVQSVTDALRAFVVSVR